MADVPLASMEKALHRTLEALGPALDKIVLVGGWVPFLYQKYLWRSAREDIPLTQDIDLGVRDAGPEARAEKVGALLRRAGFAEEPIHEGEETPVQFLWKEGPMEVKIDFITSFQTPDDTWSRFLGTDVSWARLDVFEILLKNNIPVSIEGRLVTIPSPEAFLYHKGITFANRMEESPKRFKDLYWVWWLLSAHPDPAELTRRVASFKDNEYFEAFRDNLKEYVGDPTHPGYAGLKPFLSRFGDPASIQRQLRRIFDPLLAAIQ